MRARAQYLDKNPDVAAHLLNMAAIRLNSHGGFLYGLQKAVGDQGLMDLLGARRSFNSLPEPAKVRLPHNWLNAYIDLCAITDTDFVANI